MQSVSDFKLIVAGGRDFNNPQLMKITLDGYILGLYAKGYDSVSIVCGKARGADTLGFEYALANEMQTHEFGADWERLGKRAGFVRNEAMGKFADGLVAYWDGQSRGTKHMIEFMQRHLKPVYIVKY